MNMGTNEASTAMIMCKIPPSKMRVALRVFKVISELLDQHGFGMISDFTTFELSISSKWFRGFFC